MLFVDIQIFTLVMLL